MSYTKITNFAIKDTYLTGNPAKIVKGAEIDAEFDAIATADAENAKTASLGTSAFADLTTSSLDATANRVMKTGDAGWLNTGNGPVLVNLDTTATIPSGSGRYSAGVTLGTKPTGSAANGEILVERFSATIVKETWTDVVGGSAIAPREWVRTSYAADTWGAWTEVFNAASTRLGYGVTPSAWTSALNTIDIGLGSFGCGNAAAYAQTGVNFYNDGTNNRYKTSGSAAYAITHGIFGMALSLSRAPSGTAGNVATFTNLFQIDDNGNTTVVVPTGGVGYGTGAGGAVTQLTSKATAVTLNKPCGQITMNNAALAAATRIGFNLVNSVISATDVVVATAQSSGNYRVEVAQTTVGLAVIYVTNMSAGSLSDALVINFAVIKGVNA